MAKKASATRALLLVAALAAAAAAFAEAAPSLQRPLREKLTRSFNRWNKEPIYAANSNLSSIRLKRTSEHQLDCLSVNMEDGDFYYAQNGAAEAVCGAYIVGPPDVNIEIRFNYIDVPCETGGLIVVTDGWELNGELFPSPRDHPLPLNARENKLCGSRKVKNVFVSSQNGALIKFKLTNMGSSFSFNIRYVKNPTPCNILGPYDRADEEELTMDYFYTLRNYGKRSNCSASIIFPSAVKVLDLNIGVTPIKGRAMEMETGVIHKCQKRGLEDYAQIGGSIGLDNANMQVADSLCGLHSKPERTELIECGTTTVRLTSSGAFDNSITFMMSRIDLTMPGHRSVTCFPDDILE